MNQDQIFIALVLALSFTAFSMLGFYAGAASVRGRAKPSPGHSPTPPSPRIPDQHVHTWELSSTEETDGKRVNIYRCPDCGAIERWVAPSALELAGVLRGITRPTTELLEEIRGEH